MNVRDFLAEDKTDFSKETCSIDNEWWYVKNLVEACKGLEVFDADIASMDLGVIPWGSVTILRFIQHVLDMQSVDMQYPVIMSPSGWIMNGWHRVSRAALEGKKTVKAVRLLKLPEPDGRKDIK